MAMVFIQYLEGAVPLSSGFYILCWKDSCQSNCCSFEAIQHFPLATFNSFYLFFCFLFSIFVFVFCYYDVFNCSFLLFIMIGLVGLMNLWLDEFHHCWYIFIIYFLCYLLFVLFPCGTPIKHMLDLLIIFSLYHLFSPMLSILLSFCDSFWCFPLTLSSDLLNFFSCVYSRSSQTFLSHSILNTFLN